MRVLYIDDESKACKKFAKKFSKLGVAVEISNSPESVIENLANRKKAECPDLIVVDLYGENCDAKAPTNINKRVKKQIKKIRKARKKLQKLVRKHRETVGLEFLKDVEEQINALRPVFPSKYRKLKKSPIIIRTREGLSMLDNKDLKSAKKLNVNWSLKGRSTISEKMIFDQTIRKWEQKKRKFKRDSTFFCISIFVSFLIALYFTS